MTTTVAWVASQNTVHVIVFIANANDIHESVDNNNGWIIIKYYLGFIYHIDEHRMDVD